MPGSFENPRLTPAELAALEAHKTYAAVAVVTLIATAGNNSCIIQSSKVKHQIGLLQPYNCGGFGTELFESYSRHEEFQ
jgi:hypothetical protein